MWWVPLATTAASMAYDKYSKDKAKKDAGNQTNPLAGLDTPDLQAVNYKSPGFAGNQSAETVDLEGYDPTLLQDPDKLGDPAKMQAYDWLAQEGEAQSYDAPELGDIGQVQSREAETALQGDTNLQDINIDPRLADAQMGALNSLLDIGQSGGFTAQDEADLDRVRDSSARAYKNRVGAIEQNAQMRGMGSGTMSAMLQQQAAQDAATRENDASLNIAGMAKQRALDALLSGGQLGGGIRGQEFGEQSTVKSAQDIINRFNTGNVNTGNRFNTSLANQTETGNIDRNMRGNMFDVSNQIGALQQGANAANSMEQFNVGAANQAGRDRAQNQTQASQVNTGREIDAAKFDIGNQMSTDARNTGALTDAAKFSADAGNRGQIFNADANQQVQRGNLDRTERSMVRDADAANRTAESKASLPQRQFDNQVAVAGGQAKAQDRQYNRAQSEASRDASMVGNVIKGGTDAVQAYYGRKKKKDEV